MMARFTTYEDAVALVAAVERLSVDSLAEALGVSDLAAEDLLRRLERDGHIGPSDGHGWHQPAQPSGRRRWQQPAFAPSPEARIAQLEMEVARLRHALSDAESARDLARSASDSTAAKKTRTMSVTRRRLKRLLARELHPDHQGRSDAEKAIYEDIFKRSWPRLEAVIAGRDPDED
jgi:hypothetical protein